MRISDWSSDVCSSDLARGRVGVEETVRYFAVDGLEKAMPGVTIVNGAPVVRGCRMVKSAAEIALMQLATDITMAAYRYTAPRVEAGIDRTSPRLTYRH